MENRSRGHSTNCNGKWIRRFRIESNLRSFYIDLGIPLCPKQLSVFPRMIGRPSDLIALNKSVTHHIQNTNRKLLVRSRVAFLTYISRTLSSDKMVLFRVLKDSSSSISLCLRKYAYRIDFNEYDSDSMIVSMTYYMNYYLLSCLLRKSVSLIRCYPVNMFNPCDMTVECQVAVFFNKFFRGWCWENT